MSFAEKNFQALFSSWIRKHHHGYPQLKNSAFELKICKGRRFPLSNLRTHQRENLSKVASIGFYHKISDAPFGHTGGFRWHPQRPFDCLLLQGNAFVVILFYQPRVPKQVYFIAIDKYEEIERTKKSLTSEDAKLIASLIIEL